MVLFEDYPVDKQEEMKRVFNLLVLDIDFDIDMGTIYEVLNGIEYNREFGFKDIKTFRKRYHNTLNERESSEVIGAAIGKAYYERFCE